MKGYSATRTALRLIEAARSGSDAALGQLIQECRPYLQRSLYISDMNLDVTDWDEANVERCGQLLRRHIPTAGSTDHRGFEWYYLWHRWQKNDQTPIVFQDELLESIALSPDESILASGCHDGSIVLLNATSGVEIRRWKAHPYRVPAICFSSDGQTLVSASTDHEVTLWDVDSGQPIRRLSGARAIAASPDDATIAFQTEGRSIGILTDYQTDPRIINDAHDVFVGAITFAPDGKKLASAGWDSRVVVWDVTSGQAILELEGHDHLVDSIAWSADERYLASGDVHGNIKLWDAINGEPIATLTEHHSNINALTFSPDSTELASAGADNTVKLWSVPWGQLRTNLRGHYSEVMSLVYTDNGDSLYTASIDGRVKQWDIAEELPSEILEHPNSVTSVAVDSADQLVATACIDGMVRLWSLDTGKLVKSFLAHERRVGRVRFCRVGHRQVLVSASNDFTARIWCAPRELTARPPATAVPAVPAVPDVP